MIDLPDDVLATLRVLDQAGVFNVRNGKAVLNFDADGTLTEVSCEMKLFKRGRVIPTPTHLLIVQASGTVN